MRVFIIFVALMWVCPAIIRFSDKRGEEPALSDGELVIGTIQVALTMALVIDFTLDLGWTFYDRVLR